MESYRHPALTRWLRWNYGPHGYTDSYWSTQILADPGLVGLRTCVELVFGGDRIVRLTPGPDDVRAVSGRTGEVVVYRAIGADEPTIDCRYTPGTASSEARSVSIAFPNDFLDAAAIVRQGRPLAGYGEVALLVPDGDYDERIPLIRGTMEGGVSAGASTGSLVSLTLSDAKEAANLTIPPWLVEPGTWTTPDDSATGYRYPIVVNAYDFVPTLLTDIAADPVYLVVYGHDWDVGSAVYVNGSSYVAGDAEYGWTQLETTDDKGIAVTCIQFTGTHTWDGSEAVHVSLVGAASTGEGRFADNLIDTIDFLASGFSGLGVAGTDRVAFTRASARLGHMSMRALINASGSADGARVFDYIEGELLRAFPQVSMAWTGRGYGPVVTDRRAAATMMLEVGRFPVLDRVGDWSESARAEAQNAFVYRYDYETLSNSYASVVTRDPTTSDLCRLSLEWAGPRDAGTLESPFVVDDAVAGQVVDWMVAHLTMPSYYAEYLCYPVVLLRLALGDNVGITDSELGWSEQRATVVRMSYRRGQVVLGLRVWVSYFSLGGGSSGAAAGGGQ